MFFGTHLKAGYLWDEVMLIYCLYLQKQVGKGNNLCSCAKSFARQKKTSQSKPHNFFSDKKFFSSGSKDEQPEQKLPMF
jgi:hypothetical protein